VPTGLQVARGASPDGTVTKQLVAPGMNPIAFNEEGRLFVGQAFFGTGLFELDPDLVDPHRVVIPDSGNLAKQSNGFDFGPDGMRYAPQPFLNQILRINPARTFDPSRALGRAKHDIGERVWPRRPAR
jgi:hypothetical protein